MDDDLEVTGGIVAFSLTTNTISSDRDIDLTLSGGDSGIVVVNDNLRVVNTLLVDTITERTTDAGVIVEDISFKDGVIMRATTNQDLTIRGNGTGTVIIEDMSLDSLEVDSITAATADTDLTLSGKGTGNVLIDDDLGNYIITRFFINGKNRYYRRYFTQCSIIFSK